MPGHVQPSSDGPGIVEVAYDDGGPLDGEPVHDCPPDASGTPGDDDHPSGSQA